jgi:hypothetical protein
MMIVSVCIPTPPPKGIVVLGSKSRALLKACVNL